MGIWCNQARSNSFHTSITVCGVITYATIFPCRTKGNFTMRAARRSSSCEPQCSGIVQPPKSTIRAPKAQYTAYSGVFKHCQCLKTPLYAVYCALGARMVDFGCWTIPLHYGSQLDERRAARMVKLPFVRHGLIGRNRQFSQSFIGLSAIAIFVLIGFYTSGVIQHFIDSHGAFWFQNKQIMS